MIAALAKLFGMFLLLATVVSFVLVQVPIADGLFGAELQAAIDAMASSIWWLLPVSGFLFTFGRWPLEKAGLATVAAIIALWFLFNPMGGFV